ncbi:MAG: ribosomal RNA small subunit methyltransferase A [Deltaproteobacteria bacterium]|nr:ribosomal RNA small subunit methyltransferase A [Deltaproteobacteria bacterium]
MRQTRKLSQVFLHTNWPCKKIADQLKTENVKSVLEIGPGKGILTKELLDAGLSVTSVEMDIRFVHYVMKRFASESAKGQFSVSHQNILHFDYDLWLRNAPTPHAVVGNIPYHISSDLIHWFLPKLSDLKIAVFLLQKEFAERLISPPGQKSYGSLSVYTQLRSKVSWEGKVDRDCFTPIPNVDSALVAFRKRPDKESPDLLAKVEDITKKAFSQRRKKLSNALKPYLDQMNPEDIPFNTSLRAESLSPEQFLDFARFFK